MHASSSSAVFALALVAALPVSAQTTFIHFDLIEPNSAASSDGDAQAAGIRFDFAVFDYTYDEFGDPVGQEHWQIDTTAPEVTAINPSSVDYGFAPSAKLALDARWQPVLMQFSTPTDLVDFSVTLDNSTYGNLFASDILFLAGDGAILASLATDQTIPGFTASFGSVAGVKAVLLPSGAFYDNLNITAVPVPAALPLLVSAIAGLGVFGRRRT